MNEKTFKGVCPLLVLIITPIYTLKNSKILKKTITIYVCLSYEYVFIVCNIWLIISRITCYCILDLVYNSNKHLRLGLYFLYVLCLQYKKYYY